MAHDNKALQSFTYLFYPQVKWAIHAFTPQPPSITALHLILISFRTEGSKPELTWVAG